MIIIIIIIIIIIYFAEDALIWFTIAHFHCIVVVGFIREQLVKQDVFGALLEVFVLICVQSCECKFVILFCDFFHYALAVNMSLSGGIHARFLPSTEAETQKGPTSDIRRGQLILRVPEPVLQFCRIVSPTQKISAFHHNQTALSPESHLLSCTVTFSTIPLLPGK